MSSTATAPQSAAASREPATKRLLSLDVFRGATIAAMVLVNNPGSGQYIYGPLRHAEWDGWTFTDLVFPFFLWIVGVAMTFSFSKRLEAGADRRGLFLPALKSFDILFSVGWFFYGFTTFDF